MMPSQARTARIITGTLNRPTVERIDLLLANRGQLHGLTRDDIDRLLDARLQLTHDTTNPDT